MDSSKQLIKYLVFDTEAENCSDDTYRVLSPIYVDSFAIQTAKAMAKTGVFDPYKNSILIYLYLEGASDEDIIKYGKVIADYSWKDNMFKIISGALLVNE